MNKTFAIIFCLLISVPAIFMSKPQWDLTPPMAQQPPKPIGKWYEFVLDSEFGKNLESHFNWSFGLRNFMIRLKNQFSYSVLAHSDQVVVGKNGWLADRLTSTDIFWAVDHLSDAQWAETKGHIQKLNQRLKDIGVKLYLMPLPLKTTIFPEEFPATAATRKDINGFLKLRDYLNAQSEIGFVDAYQALKGAPTNKPVFYKTDLHWNDRGALAVSQAIVKKISDDNHQTVAWMHPTEFNDADFSGGGDAVAMGLLFPLSEVRPVLNTSLWKPCGTYPASGNIPKPFDARFVQDGSCKGGKLGPTLMVGNSFMLYFYWNGLVDHFEKFYSLHDLTQFQNLLANIPAGTKTVIWQSFESEIAYQMQDPAWWKQLDSEAKLVKIEF